MKSKPATAASRVKAFAVLSTIVLLSVLLPWGCVKHENPKVKEVALKQIADGLVSPIGVVAVPDNSKRLFVIDQIGKVWIIDRYGNRLSTPFLDLTSKLVPLSASYDERGLLGLAFHPDYKDNGRFFVYYQLPPRSGGPAPGVLWNNLSRIAEFRVSADRNIADFDSEKILFDIDDPQSNHNGGTLAFGADGYLYISIGDGGGANDVGPGHVTDWYSANGGGNGQDVDSNLLGNILRVDVNSKKPYGIPADNPFVNKPGMDEIYAFGFRNPFRFSFDMGGSHELIAGDAGQALWEEIDLVKKGGNYGWNVKEGMHCFNATNNEEVLPVCPPVDNKGNPLIDPVIELKNSDNPAGGNATVVIGGNVYRGAAIPGWYGKYIFGTLSQSETTANGQLFMATPAGSTLWHYDQLSLKNHPDNIGYYLKGFGQDNDGEIYVTVSSILGPSGNTGKVYKLVMEDDGHNDYHDGGNDGHNDYHNNNNNNNSSY
jgi:glucose/arabinose dehydrogenase